MCLLLHFAAWDCLCDEYSRFLYIPGIRLSKWGQSGQSEGNMIKMRMIDESPKDS